MAANRRASTDHRKWNERSNRIPGAPLAISGLQRGSRRDVFDDIRSRQDLLSNERETRILFNLIYEHDYSRGAKAET
jgi:hypothetical protein